MADPTHSGNSPGWGGIRRRSWREEGGSKRAVVMVDGEAYQFVTELVRLARRPAQDLCPQIFLAGLEALLGVDRDTLMEAPFTIKEDERLPLKRKVRTYDELQALARRSIIFEEEESVGA